MTGASQKLRVGIDARRLGNARTGIGRYLYELLLRLPNQLPDSIIYLYSNKPIADVPDQLPLIHRVDSGLVWSRMPGVLWLKGRCARLLQRDEIDVFWASGTLGPGRASRVPVVTTVYDLNHILAADTMQLINRWSYQRWFQQDVASAQRVSCISRGTASRLLDLQGIATHSVIYPAVADDFSAEPGIECDDVLNMHGLKAENYFLAVATLEPRKRIPELLTAFEKVCAANPQGDTKLVLVGGAGWKTGRLEQIDNIPQDRLLIMGRVSDQVLRYLYAHSLALVFPSSYEGYGIPVAEARALGARVLASDIPELREAGDNQVLYLDPFDEQAWVQAMLALIAEPPTIGRYQSAESWDVGAQKLAEQLQMAAMERD